MPARGNDLCPVQRASHAADAVAPTAVAERVSDEDEEEDGNKSTASRRRPAKPPVLDGYCQCKDMAVPATAGDVVDRRPVNLCRDFRAIQRSINASKVVPVPKPLRSASVDRHGDGWSGTSSAKYQPINGGPVVSSRHNGSSAYRVCTPKDLAVPAARVRTSRRQGIVPPRDGVGREITGRVTDCSLTARQVSSSVAPHAAVESDVASDVSDLDQDIVDDLHLAETVPDFTRPARRSSDTPRTDVSKSRQSGRTATDFAPVMLRRASAQDQVGSAGVPPTTRTQRAGSYHGSVHHSVTMSDFASLASNNPRSGIAVRSPVGSLKNALASFAGRWSRSGRRFSTSRSDVTELEDGKTGCAADHGIMHRIVARASCRLPKNRSKSGERSAGDAARSVSGGGRVTVTAVSLRHDEVTSSDQTTSTIYGDERLSNSVDTDQHRVPYIDDSDSE